MVLSEINWQERVIAECMAEVADNDPVAQTITYHYFVSRSKGWRHSEKRGWYQRRRRNWKEVSLVRYRSGPFLSWHRCPFDEWATEILGAWATERDLEPRIRM